MTEHLKQLILDRWEEYAPGERRPADLSFVIVGGLGLSYRRPFAKDVLMVFPRGASSPRFVAKYTVHPAYGSGVKREYERITVARADLPESITRTLPEAYALETIGSDTVLIGEAARGIKVSHTLVVSGARYEALLPWAFDCAIDWLIRFSTAQPPGREQSAQVRERLLSALDLFEGTFDLSEDEKRCVAEIRESVPGFTADLPLVHEHGDLWSGNIFTEREGGPVAKVIDWEAYQSAGLPLFDMFLLGTSLCLTPQHRGAYESLSKLMLRNFAAEGPGAPKFAAALKTYMTALGIAPDADAMDRLFFLWLAALAVAEQAAYGSHFTMDPKWREAFGAFVTMRERLVWRSKEADTLRIATGVP